MRVTNEDLLERIKALEARLDQVLLALATPKPAPSWVPNWSPSAPHWLPPQLPITVDKTTDLTPQTWCIEQ